MAQGASQYGARGGRYDRGTTTTRRQCAPRHGPARGMGIVGAQAGFRVCTWCTQPNFDLVYCSESLFETLFMKTVHKHCSRGFEKKILNEFFFVAYDLIYELIVLHYL